VVAELGIEEAHGAGERNGELRLDHFDRDLAVVSQVEGQVHVRHAARAKLALEAVSVSEGCCEVRPGFAHG